jgi:membrane protein DedA with SNARE-associated domain
MARIASRSTGFSLLDTTLFFAAFLELAVFVAHPLPKYSAVKTKGALAARLQNFFFSPSELSVQLTI